jgi:DNA-binding response OmpR family regulator
MTRCRVRRSQNALYFDGGCPLVALERNPSDVVVLDLQRPTLDGVSCLGEIRRRGLPVRVLTAFSTEAAGFYFCTRGARSPS